MNESFKDFIKRFYGNTKKEEVATQPIRRQNRYPVLFKNGRIDDKVLEHIVSDVFEQTYEYYEEYYEASESLFTLSDDKNVVLSFNGYRIGDNVNAVLQDALRKDIESMPKMNAKNMNNNAFVKKYKNEFSKFLEKFYKEF